MSVLAAAGTLLLLEFVIWVAFRRVRGGGLWRRRMTAAALVTVAPIAVVAAYARFAPLESPYDRLVSAGVVVLDSNGIVLQRDASAGLRIPTDLDRVAPIMVETTIAAEDARFRSHPGIDPFATARSLVAMPFRRSGASTLTQQLARRLYLSDFEGSLVERKAREALIALQLDARFSKDEILELYLNNVYYGNGAYGVEAAARVYFGVSAANLDLAQAAFLAGLPQMPGVYGGDPLAPVALSRRDYVLERLAKNGRISRTEASLAAAEPLTLLQPQAGPIAPHFVQFVLEEVAATRPDLSGRRDLVIETTLDARLQSEAEDILTYYLDQLKDRQVGNGAVVVLEPGSGRIITMVGSAGFTNEAIAGQYNMALQPRQPGSALKPFLYLTALENGFTAATPILDVPVTFSTPGGPYTPLNYDRRFYGVVPLRVALASSLNVPAVRTLDTLGIDAFLETAHRFGLNTLTDTEVYGLALTLGGGEVRLLDLTAAYSALANLGLRHEPFAVQRVLDQSGEVLYQRGTPEADQVADPGSAFIIADVLSDPIARQTGFGGSPVLELPFPAAVKTGTTTEFRDNWTVGFTPQRSVGVWVGNADNRPMANVSGVTGAAPIWHAVMEAAHREIAASWPSPPVELSRATTCPPTGLRPGPNCANRVEEWFLPGTAPDEVEAYFVVDSSGRLVIDPPAEARAWALEAGVPLLMEPSDQAPEAAFTVFPAAGTRFFMAPEVPGQSLLLRASLPAGVVRVEFRVDGELFATTSALDPVARWPVQPGLHWLHVVAFFEDRDPVSVDSSFQVSP